MHLKIEHVNKMTQECFQLLLSKVPYSNYTFFANLFYNKSLYCKIPLETMIHVIRIQEKFQYLCLEYTFAPRMLAISIYGNDFSRWDYAPLTDCEVCKTVRSR